MCGNWPPLQGTHHGGREDFLKPVLLAHQGGRRKGRVQKDTKALLQGWVMPVSFYPHIEEEE